MIRNKPRREELKDGEVLCEYCTAKCCKYFALPIETPEDAEDFEPVRKLRWRERSTDEDQHRCINRVRNVQEVLNQPHQRYQPERQNKRAQAEQLEHQSLSRTLENRDVVSGKSINSRSTANEGDTKIDNSSMSPIQEGASTHWEDSPSSAREDRNISPGNNTGTKPTEIPHELSLIHI